MISSNLGQMDAFKKVMRRDQVTEGRASMCSFSILDKIVTSPSNHAMSGTHWIM